MTMAIGAASPGRGPVLRIRRKPSASCSRTEIREQLADGFLVAQAIERQAAIGHAVFFRQRNQRLHHTAQFLGFGQGRTNGFVFQHRRRHVAKHGLAMRAVTTQSATGFSMAHFSVLS